MDSKFQEALSAIDEAAIIELEKQLVSIPSYTTEESELAEFIADYLNENGVEVGLQRVPFPKNQKSPSIRSFNVIGRIHGTGDAPSLMFNGHMDHNPIDGRYADDLSNWERPPFKPVVEGEFLYGKGCQDEKGGICAFLTAAVTIRRLGVRLQGDLITAAVCGHKAHSSGTKYLINSGLRSDMAINTENSGNAIVILHIGEMTAKIDVEGSHPHPTQRSRFPKLAGEPTPFQRVIRILEAIGPESARYSPGGWLRFKRHPQLKDFPCHRIGKVESRDLLHKIIELWFYTPPGVTPESLKEDLNRLINELRSSDPGFRAEVETQAFGLALETPFDAQVVQSLARWHREIAGEEAKITPEARYGLYGDASVLSEAGITAAVYGPGGGLSDLDYERRILQGQITPDERISVHDLVVAAKVCTLTAVDISG